MALYQVCQIVALYSVHDSVENHYVMPHTKYQRSRTGGLRQEDVQALHSENYLSSFDLGMQ